MSLVSSDSPLVAWAELIWLLPSSSFSDTQNGLTAPLSYFRNAKSSLSFDTDPSATVDSVGRVLRQVTQLVLDSPDTPSIDRM